MSLPVTARSEFGICGLDQFNVHFTGLQVGTNPLYGKGGHGDQHLLLSLFHQLEIVEFEGAVFQSYVKLTIDDLNRVFAGYIRGAAEYLKGDKFFEMLPVVADPGIVDGAASLDPERIDRNFPIDFKSPAQRPHTC